MKKFILTAAIALIIIAKSQAQDVVSYVQPLSGTASATTHSAARHGAGTELNANTIPAVTLPFGMTQWTPQTSGSENKCVPPYLFKDSLLSGFRASHWLSGSCTQDYGSFTIMPISGHLKTLPTDYATPFSHKNEISSPNYYQVTLPNYQIKAEMTATQRCGILQFTALKADSIYLLITPNSDRGEGFIRVDAKKGLIWGYNPVHRIYQGWGKPAGFNGYFVIQVQSPVSVSGVYREGRIMHRDSLHNGNNIGAYLGFKLRTGQKLCIRVGTSFTSLAGAFKNLKAEITNPNFNLNVVKNKRVWQNALGQINIQTANLQHKRIFYTAMYHAMQQPRLFSDVDGRYPQFSGDYKIKQLTTGNYFDDFSMWDIYRAQLPLFEVLKPALVNDFVRSLILKGQQGGWMPIFPCWNSYTAAMVGDHTTAFISSAYVRGIRNYNVAEAYRLMRQNAFETPDSASYKDGKGRRALTSYLKYGYIPMEDPVREAFHQKEQVSRTLEYAFDDYALAQVAKGQGKEADYQALIKRSLNYRNIFDPTVNMVRGRNIDKSWYQPFSPSTKEPYITEGTPQQYTFYTPQDVKGLARLMGGTNALEVQLDKLFAAGEYWHGNEPGQQTPFMYNFTPAPWKTQLHVKQILEDEYTDGPGGLSGNDDAGQLSAWYVLASLGFYPLNPASDQYLLTTPLFNSYQINLPGGKRFKVITHRNAANAMYIQSIKYNGVAYTKTYLTHKMIMNGGTLEFNLSTKPNKNWGTKASDQPASLSD